MSKHTPGPWRINGGGKLRWISADSKVATHSDDVNRDAPSDNMVCESVYEADAILIAAAPELLEALKALDVLFSPCVRDSTQADWIDKARAAIAKATGEPA